MSDGNLYSKKELLWLQQALRQKRQKQQQEDNACKRKSRKPSAVGDSSALNAEPGAGENGGGAGSSKSPAPSAADDSDCEIVNAEPGAGEHGGGAGSGTSPASRAAYDSDCEIVEAGAGEHEGGAKTLRGNTLHLKQDDPPLLVKHMSPGESCQVRVETKILRIEKEEPDDEILRQKLQFLKTKNIASSFDKKRMLVNITALDCTSVTFDIATIQFVDLDTGKVVGSIEIYNKTSWVSTFSQKSNTDRRAHLRTLGLQDVSDDPSESDIRKAYHKMMLLRHPDKTGDSSQEAMKKYHAVEAAYRALTR